MTVAYGSISSTTFAARTNTTITAPASISNGDVLVAIVTTTGTSSAPSVTPPAGWTQYGTLEGGIGTGGLQAAYCFVKVASGESGNYTFTHSNANIGSQGIILRYTGSNGTVNAVSSNYGNPANSTRTATSVTTTVDNCMLLYLGWDFTDTGTETPPTGMTERFDTSPLYAAELLLGAAGATGDKTNTCNSASGDPRGAWLLALEPSSSNQTVTGVKYSNTQTFGTAVIGRGSVGVTGVKFTNTQSFKNAVVSSSYPIVGTKFTNSQTFGTSVVGRGTVGITGVKFTNSQTFGTAVIGSGSSPITGVKFTNSQVFYNSVITKSYTITGSKTTNSQTFGTGVISKAYTITGVKFTNTNSFGSSSITTVRGITGSKFTNTQSYGTAVITVAGQGITGSKFQNNNSFGTAVITTGSVGITGTKFTNTQTFGSATLQFTQDISGLLVTNNQEFFTASLNYYSLPYELDSGVTLENLFEEESQIGNPIYDETTGPGYGNIFGED